LAMIGVSVIDPCNGTTNEKKHPCNNISKYHHKHAVYVGWWVEGWGSAKRKWLIQPCNGTNILIMYSLS